jgi:hypothetical protein
MKAEEIERRASEIVDQALFDAAKKTAGSDDPGVIDRHYQNVRDIVDRGRENRENPEPPAA